MNDEMLKDIKTHITSDINIEEAKAFWLDENYIIEQPEPVLRLDTSSGRFYLKIVDGKVEYFPSVTTIIQAVTPTPIGLQMWRSNLGWEQSKKEARIAAGYGTLLHIIFAEILRGQKIDISKEAMISRISYFSETEDFYMYEIDVDEWTLKIKQDIIGFIRWCKDYSIEPIAIEMTLAGLGYSGTLDLICMATIKNEKKRILVDFKSGRNGFYDDHVYQLTAYLHLWNNTFEEMKIDTVYNYGCKDYRFPIGKTVSPYNFKNQPIESEKWFEYLKIFQMDESNLKPKKKTTIKDCVVDLSTDTNEVFEIFDPETFLTGE